MLYIRWQARNKCLCCRKGCFPRKSRHPGAPSKPHAANRVRKWLTRTRRPTSDTTEINSNANVWHRTACLLWVEYMVLCAPVHQNKAPGTNPFKSSVRSNKSRPRVVFEDVSL